MRPTAHHPHPGRRRPALGRSRPGAAGTRQPRLIFRTTVYPTVASTVETHFCQKINYVRERRRYTLVSYLRYGIADGIAFSKRAASMHP